jgi:hypothetical protein
VVNVVSSANNPVNIDPVSQAREALIEEAISLIAEVKKQAGIFTGKELLNLLIQYILAMMMGDRVAANAIHDQIGKLLDKYGKDIKKADDLQSKLKESGNKIDLTVLQGLINALKLDQSSGDMSNLSPLLND